LKILILFCFDFPLYGKKVASATVGFSFSLGSEQNLAPGAYKEVREEAGILSSGSKMGENNPLPFKALS